MAAGMEMMRDLRVQFSESITSAKHADRAGPPLRQKQGFREYQRWERR